FVDQVAKRHSRLLWLKLVRALVVVLEAGIVVVLMVCVLVGGHHVKDVVLDPVRLQRAVLAADQASLEEAASPGVVLPALQLVAFEQRLEVLGAVGRDVKDDRRVLPRHGELVVGWNQERADSSLSYSSTVRAAMAGHPKWSITRPRPVLPILAARASSTSSSSMRRA